MQAGTDESAAGEATTTPALVEPDPAVPGEEPLGLPHGEASVEADNGTAPEPIRELQSPATPPCVEVQDLDWEAIRNAVDPAAIRGRMRDTVEKLEALLDQPGGPGMLFDDMRANPADRAIRIAQFDADRPLWIIGDLHGDLLALEAGLALLQATSDGGPANVVFLGDLFDDEGFGLETLLRVFELILDCPGRVCLIAGNHDEALGYDGARFLSSVAPSDFADFLNDNRAHEWIERAGKLAVRVFAAAPRALFFPDGLLVAHGGFPLADQHARLAETGDWNDPGCLTDFVWTRAHPKARKKLPNRFSRGSQFGHEDFASFCTLAASLGRPVTHMVRGHDHPDERYAVYPAYAKHPVLTTVALSRRLPREGFGPYARVPTIARYVHSSLPVIHRLHVPAEIVRDVYPEPQAEIAGPGTPAEDPQG